MSNKYPNYKRPKTKSMLMPYVNESNTGVRFGGNQANIAREIETDTPEELVEFLKLLDGKNCIDFISNKLQLSTEDVIEILNILYESSVISENDSSIFEFCKEEIEYYSRNIGFFEWIDVNFTYYNYWELQNNLKKSTVLLLGAGGTGAVSAKQLARLGIGNIIVVDYDNVELSNLNRQEFDYSHVGMKKIYALENIIKRINPFIRFSPVDKFIKSKDDILELTEEFNPDIIISCIDMPQDINNILCECTINTNIPWIMGGYASTIMNHAVFYKDSPTYRDVLEKTTYNTFDGKSLLDNTNVWKWDNSVISPIATISGAISVFYCFAFLSNLVKISPSKFNHLDFFNIDELENFVFCIS